MQLKCSALFQEVDYIKKIKYLWPNQTLSEYIVRFMCLHYAEETHRSTIFSHRTTSEAHFWINIENFRKMPHAYMNEPRSTTRYRGEAKKCARDRVNNLFFDSDEIVSMCLTRFYDDVMLMVFWFCAVCVSYLLYLAVPVYSIGT